MCVSYKNEHFPLLRRWQHSSPINLTFPYFFSVKVWVYLKRCVVRWCTWTGKITTCIRGAPTPFFADWVEYQCCPSILFCDLCFKKFWWHPTIYCCSNPPPHLWAACWHSGLHTGGLFVWYRCTTNLNISNCSKYYWHGTIFF